MVGPIVRDFRFAIRGLLRSPWFTATAVLTLALGIGATTAVFSVIYAIVFRPLPFPNADRLVQIVQVLEPTPNSPEPSRAGLTPNQFVDLHENSRTLSAVGGYAPVSRTFTEIDVPMRLSGAAVTAGLFAGLGVSPAMGRTFVAEDSEPGADSVIILSHQTWVRYFGRDPDILERRMTLDDTRPRVVGVMPEGFGFPSLAEPSMGRNSAGELNDAPEFWLPALTYQRTVQTGGFSLFQAFGILREDVSRQQALEEVRSLLSSLPQGRRATVEIVSARREMSRRIGGVLMIFQLGVALIFLIACVNVVNLLLTRAAHKRREIAIRMALGASRARIARESVAESVLLALCGGAIGCLFAYALTGAIRALPPHLLPRVREIRLDEHVLLSAVALSVGSGVAIGLFSAFRAGRLDSAGHDASQALRGPASSPPRRLRPSGLLVVTEVAASMVLLAGAGLLVNSFARLMQVDPGFRAERALTFRLALPNSRYASPQVQQEFVRELLITLRGLPEIEAVAASSYSLEAVPIGFFRLLIDGQTASGGIRYRFITPDYFRTLGIPVRDGREFRDMDRSPVAARVVVDEAFAERYFGTHNVVGTYISYGDRPSLEIVGVVANSRARLDADPRPTLYLPADERAPFGNPSFVVRTSVDPRAVVPSVREIVRRNDPRLAVYNVMTLEEMLDHASASPRLYGLVSFWCAITALLLAGIGLYGVLAYSVGARTREFGIRMALGARARNVIASVMGEGLALAVAGMVIGLAGAYYATRFLDSLLFGLTPHDPATFISATAMFVVVALTACYIPSRRATRVDPVVALRAE